MTLNGVMIADSRYFCGSCSILAVELLEVYVGQVDRHTHTHTHRQTDRQTDG